MQEAKVKAKELRELIEKQQYKCALTGRGLTPETAAADHIQPVSNGGGHVIENIQILHRDVNAAKGTMNNEEFLRMCYEVIEHNQDN
jgi:5-methylcytosine-specific restriction endonuclease McrA